MRHKIGQPVPDYPTGERYCDRCEKEFDRISDIYRVDTRDGAFCKSCAIIVKGNDRKNQKEV